MHNDQNGDRGGEPLRDQKAINGAFKLDDTSLSHHRDSVYAQAPGNHLSYMAADGGARRRRHKRRSGKTSNRSAGSSGVTPKAGASTAADNNRQGLAPGERVQFLLDQQDEFEDPHPVFTEMEELTGSGANATWKEVARWVKFEEDVEEGGNRWSKPHVATLSLHSLFELRVCVVNGTVIFDMEADSLEQIIDIMLDKMLANRQLEFMYREDVRECLLRRKTHQYESHKHKDNQGNPSSGGSFISTVRSIADIGKTFSSKNLQPHHDHEGNPIVPQPKKSVTVPAGSGAVSDEPQFAGQSTLGANLSQPKMSSATGQRESTVKFDIHDAKSGMTASPSNTSMPINRKISKTKGSESTNSLTDLLRKKVKHRAHFRDETNGSGSLGDVGNNEGTGTPQNGSTKLKGNLHFFKKLPPGVEASNVLVGEVDFLSHHVSTFIRMAKPLMLDGLTEVPVPTRFLFILLGPIGHSQQYHEIGRAIATLMSDEVFHDVAYKARTTEDLCDGIDEFLDQVTVLPPGEWDPNIRIEPPSHVPPQTNRLKSQQSDSKTNAGAGGDGGGNGNGDLLEELLVVEKEEEGGHGNDPALKRSGRIFGGLIQDIKRKIPFYVSEYTDALNMQCVATVFFMYFALLAPIVTFGGLLEEATNQRMAAMENLLSGAICGVTYHVFSGQPLTVIGSTGPVLVFETIIKELCDSAGLNYLCFRLWINIWTAAILMFMVATDASSLVTYITRFTEESFATLIAVIFIFEALKKLLIIKRGEVHVSEYNPPTGAYNPTILNGTCACLPPPNDTFSRDWFNKSMKKHRWTDGILQQKPWAIYDETNLTGINYQDLPLDFCNELHGELAGPACYKMEDVFLMSALLMIGTYLLATCLKQGKTSPYFPSFVRQIASDFAVMIAIVVMVGVDMAIGVPTPKLNVPSKFAPTLPGRNWLISPFENPIWSCIAAVIPAILGSILIFMDQQITAVIVNRKENKLKKGCGYHLDLFVICVQLVVVGFLGIPIYVAATVLSINHVNSLRVESESRAPGEVASFVGCREQRVTGILTFVLIGLSVFMTGVLRYIPMPVLYGVFLYMGISALNGIQLFDRLLLLFMPKKYQPDYMYLRLVPINQVHIYTAFQVLCLALLWGIKSIKVTSITFPIMLVLMIGMRKGLEYIYNPTYLHVLDDKMPEFHLRKKEDAKKKLEQAERTGDELDEPGAIQLRPVATEAHLHIPMASGNVMKIPLSSLDETLDLERPINISDEMKKSSMYKHISHHGQQSNGDQPATLAPTTAHGKKFQIGEDDDVPISINLHGPSPAESTQNIGPAERQPLLGATGSKDAPKSKDSSPV